MVKLALGSLVVAGIYSLAPAPESQHVHQWKPSRAIERQYLKAYALREQSPQQGRCLLELWQRESGWRHDANNPESSAYGIAQVLRTPRTLTPYQQVDRGLKYIKHRYQTPCRAWRHWQRHEWY